MNDREDFESRRANSGTDLDSYVYYVQIAMIAEALGMDEFDVWKLRKDLWGAGFYIHHREDGVWRKENDKRGIKAASKLGAEKIREVLK